ncbi:MAG: DUF302 domain-containing protein [Rhizobiaceae bacterium]|nr:DUF302 domain-containing protein [Rhizobiaceae bacterium]
MSRTISFILSLATALVLGGTALAGQADETGWIVKNSKHSVEETADKLVKIIEKAPPKLFARIDHSAGAKKAGLELPPATMIMFGAPAIGTPVMQGNIRAGLDLPVRVLIWDENGQTKIGYLDPEALKTRYAITGADKAFEQMTGALEKFTSGAAN